MSQPPNAVLEAAGQPPPNLFGFLGAAAREFPQRTATHFFGARLSYADLLGHSLRLSRSLSAQGVGRGTPVALMLPNCPQAVLAFFALQHLGAVCVMVNPTSPAAEVRHLLEDSGAQAIVVLDQFLAEARLAATPALRVILATSVADFLPFHLGALYRLKTRSPRQQGAAGPPVRRLRDLLKGSAAAATSAARPEDIALIQYTGGTTGRPKGVVLTQGNLVANVVQVGEWLGAEAGRGREVLLAVLPYFHVFGLTCALLFPVGLAATIILQPRFEVAEVIKAIERQRPTMLPAIPAMFAALVRDPQVVRRDFSSLKWCISGASALTSEAAQTFRERTGGVDIIQGYGLTEAAPVTHVNPATGVRKPGSIGMPLPRTRCRIVDLEAGERELAMGEAGELCLAGPQVMAGYWRLAEETAATLRGEWLYTGDIAHVDEGGYYYIVDRKKEMIITAGLNVYPSEVEAAILEMAGVREAAVIGLPEDLRGEQVAAYLVLDEGARVDAQAVREHCRERLAPYKVPRIIRFRVELPKSLIGKVLKRELRRQAVEER